MKLILLKETDYRLATKNIKNILFKAISEYFPDTTGDFEGQFFFDIQKNLLYIYYNNEWHLVTTPFQDSTSASIVDLSPIWDSITNLSQNMKLYYLDNKCKIEKNYYELKEEIAIIRQKLQEILQQQKEK